MIRILLIELSSVCKQSIPVEHRKTLRETAKKQRKENCKQYQNPVCGTQVKRKLERHMKIAISESNEVVKRYEAL